MIWIFFLIIPPNYDIIEDKVDWFELNHKYSQDGSITFDQVILWEWVKTSYGGRVPMVVEWYMLNDKQCREQLTPAELAAKNAEVRDKWIKEKRKGFAPPYVPEFKYVPGCPRYDHGRNKWVVIFNHRGTMRKVYADSYYESFTTYDPEVENRRVSMFYQRRGLRRIK